MITLAVTAARTLRSGEGLPDSLDTGFERLRKLDRDWIWVVEGEHGIESALIAAPAHGIAVLLRIYAISEAATDGLVKLLRKVMHDCHNRGYDTYMVGIDNNDPAAAALIRIITKAGGRIFGQQTVYAGSTDIGGL